MKIDPKLKIDWCTVAAARYSVEHWHYSKSLPAGKLVKIGVWEFGQFIGCVLFGRGANRSIGTPYGLTQTECCELVRVALNSHLSTVTQIISRSIKMLRQQSPGIRLIVSYADQGQGHHGGIYQAGNWLYMGTAAAKNFVIHGKTVHPKSIYSKYGKGSQRLSWLKKNIDRNAQSITCALKHKYVMPLDKKMRKKLLPETKPYPKGDSSGQI